ncbi:DUF354 domain-containing protein [Halorientalis salina]|uniref:DUF354 domain-containing protein n=1 Tax=Halorientalis salina TaxID=2932266 RepID=UPI0010AC6763|nr:DUF354 domain-containing protein [Halorientalis salina]
MKVIVTIQHAGHVHFFKHAIAELTDQGHEVRVFARDNESSVELLDRCDIEYELLAGSADSLPSLAAAQAVYEARLLRAARAFDPDVMTAIGGVAVSHVASVTDARSVVFYDTEHATLIRRLAFPFADTVCTPDCFSGDIGAAHVRYPSYHELAYLHPDRFTPQDEADVLADLDVDPDGPIVLLRLGDWGSSHDIGASGVSDPLALIEALEADGADVLVTAEGEVPAAVATRLFSLAPERFHDLLAAVDLYVGEGATTAAECAVLGTPAVYVSTLQLGYLQDIESSYGLVANCSGDDRGRRTLEVARRFLDTDTEEWERRREMLLADKLDTTDVILDQLTPAVDRPSKAATPDPIPGTSD